MCSRLLRDEDGLRTLDCSTLRIVSPELLERCAGLASATACSTQCDANVGARPQSPTQAQVKRVTGDPN